MSNQTVSFVRSTVERFPSLYGPLEEHIRDNYGEVLPHVFFGDVTRYVVSLLLAARSGANLPPRRELRDILSYLEEAYASGDEEIRGLISVSFLENLPRPGESGAKLREMVGPNLMSQLRAIG
jgi:hypothetical protein